MGGYKTRRSLQLPSRFLKFIQEIYTVTHICDLNGLSHIYVHMVSITHYYLKALSLVQLLVWEGKDNAHARDRGRDEEPQIAQVQFKNQIEVMSFQ